MNTYRCPQLQRINNYLNGTLSGDQSLELEQHLDQCNTCGETLRGLAESVDITLNEELRLVMKVQAPSDVAIPASESAGFDPEPSSLAPTSTDGGAIDSRSKNDCGSAVPPAEQPLIDSLVRRLQSLDPKEMAQRSRIKEERAAEVLWVLGGAIDSKEDGATLGKLDHYELIELLGSGSTGVVFSALDTRLNREVAIKVLRPSLGSAARSRFLKEARAAASCRHENIVTVFDIGQAEDDHGLAYITMELLPGETLEDRLNRVTFLPESDVRDLADKISAALAAAHHQGIVHRDLKPANIWVHGDFGDSAQIKLLDFGLARAIDADQQMTATGILSGTPNFMSPEQTRGLELDGRSDLFSLGCLLYRSITGRLPFNSTGVLSTLQSIQHHQPTPPSKLNPACSPAFSSLIMTLLEKQPDLRPASGEEVQHALKTTSDRWRFKPSVGIDDSQPRDVSQPDAGGSCAKRKWSKLIAAGLVGLLGCAGWMFGSDIILIATNQGEIMIETTDKDVKVEILQNGELVRIIDPASASRIDLSAGQYTLQTGSGNAAFAVTPSEIKLARGGKETIRVTQSLKGSAEGEVQNVQLGSKSGPSTSVTYNGKTFDEWIQVLKTERKEKVVCDGIEGLGELSKDNAAKRKIALEAVTPIIRQYGSIFYGGKNDEYNSYFDALKTYFQKVPYDELVEFIVQELRSGTNQSREYTYHISSTAALGIVDSNARMAMKEVFTTNQFRILDAWICSLEDAAKRNDLESIKSLSLVASQIHHWLWFEWVMMKPNRPKLERLDSDSELVRRIRSAWQNQSHSLARLALARCLLEVSDDATVVAVDLCKQLETTSISCSEQKEVLEALSLCHESCAANTIPALTKFGKRLLEHLDINEAMTPGTPFNTDNKSFLRKNSEENELPYRIDLTSNGFVLFRNFMSYDFTTSNQGELKLGYAELTTNQGLLLSAIELQTNLAGQQKLPQDVTEPALQWFASMKKTVNIDEWVNRAKKPSASNWPVRHELEPRLAFQYALNHFSELAIEAFNDSGSQSTLHKPKADLAIPVAEDTNESLNAGKSSSFSEATLPKTFNGKTSEEWLKILKTELNHSLVCDAIAGLGELTREDPEKRKTVLDAIRPIMRRFGSRSFGGIESNNELYHEAFKAFFGKSQPEELLEFTIEELKNGTRQSCDQLFWISLPGSLDIIDTTVANKISNCFESNQPRILAAWIERVDATLKADDEDFVNSLESLGLSTRFWSTKKQSGKWGVVDNLPPDSQAIICVRKAWQDESDTRKRIFLGCCLLAISSEGREYLLDLCRLLNNGSLKLDDRMRILKTIWKSQEPWMVEAIPSLKEYGKQLVKQLNHDDQDPRSRQSLSGRQRHVSYTQLYSKTIGFQIESSGFIDHEFYAGPTSLIGAQLTTNQGLLLQILSLQTSFAHSGRLSQKEAEPTLQWLASLKKEVDTDKLIKQLEKELEKEQAKQQEMGGALGGGGSGFDAKTSWTLDPDLAFQFVLNKYADEAIEAIKKSSSTSEDQPASPSVKRFDE